MDYFLFVMLRRAPMILLCLGGIVFAIIRWKRHPRASLMTLLGLGIYLVEAFVFTCLSLSRTGYMWLLRDELQRLIGEYASSLDIVLIVLDDFAYAAVIVLLVTAVFTGRNREGNLY